MSTTDLYADPRRENLMNLAEDATRARLANELFARHRAGAAIPHAIYYGTIEHLRDRLGTWGTEDASRRAVLGLLLRHRAEALDYCAWAIDWDRLPHAEKERQKAARGEEHRRAWMDTQPATPKQVAYCRSLGHVGAIHSRAHASQIIDTLKQRRAS